jgi:hypothetical protein
MIKKMIYRIYLLTLMILKSGEVAPCPALRDLQKKILQIYKEMFLAL